MGSEGLEIRAIKFAFNMYTGPGYLGALLGLVNIALLVFFFKDCRLYFQHGRAGRCGRKRRRGGEEWEKLAQSLVEEEERKSSSMSGERMSFAKKVTKLHVQ